MSVNEKLVRFIEKKAKELYANDIAMVLIYGSFVNKTSNPRSDVDCYFIPKTKRGYAFAADFIIDGIGYDIFPIPWERVEKIARLDDFLLPCLGDSQVLYCAFQEDKRRFESLKEEMRQNLENESYAKKKAKERFDEACGIYRRLEKAESLSEKRRAAGYILMLLAESVALYNGTYFHFGLKKQYEDLQRLTKLPEGFLDGYVEVIKAENAENIRKRSEKLLKGVQSFGGWEAPEGREAQEEAPHSAADYEALARFYEELCSTFNKVYVCCESGNFILAYLSAVCLQNELYEISREQGVARLDILENYCWDAPELLAEAAKRAETELVRIIEEGGGRIKRFAGFEEFEKAKL